MKENKKRFKFKLLGIVGIGAIFVLSWIYYYFPLATIVITPKIALVTQNTAVAGSIELKNIDWENHILPLHKFEVTITDEEEIEVSGERKIGDKRAKGKVRFINERKEEIKIPAGTLLLGEKNMQYKTSEEVIVPAVQVDYLMDVQVGRKAGQREAEVVAVVKGSEANAAIGKINNFVKAIKDVHVINPEPIMGGVDIIKKVVSKKDQENLRENLKGKIKTQLLNKIYQELGGNYRVIEDEINYSQLEYNFKQKPGDLSSVLEGSATLVASGYLIKNSELDRLATNIFQNNLEEGQKLLSKGIVIKEIKLAEKENGLYNIIMKSTGQIIPHINIDSLQKKLAGIALNEAKEILNKEKVIDKYRIETRSEDKKLPLLTFAIKVITSAPENQQVINLK